MTPVQRDEQGSVPAVQPDRPAAVQLPELIPDLSSKSALLVVGGGGEGEGGEGGEGGGAEHVEPKDVPMVATLPVVLRGAGIVPHMAVLLLR